MEWRSRAGHATMRSRARRGLSSRTDGRASILACVHAATGHHAHERLVLVCVRVGECLGLRACSHEPHHAHKCFARVWARVHACGGVSWPTRMPSRATPRVRLLCTCVGASACMWGSVLACAHAVMGHAMRAFALHMCGRTCIHVCVCVCELVNPQDGH